jgi:hypothetical protein
MEKLKCSRQTLRTYLRKRDGLEGFRLRGGRRIYTTVEAIGRFMVPLDVQSPDECSGEPEEGFIMEIGK